MWFISLLLDIWAVIRVAKLVRRAFFPTLIALFVILAALAVTSHLVAFLLGRFLFDGVRQAFRA